MNQSQQILEALGEAERPTTLPGVFKAMADVIKAATGADVEIYLNAHGKVLNVAGTRGEVQKARKVVDKTKGYKFDKIDEYPDDPEYVVARYKET